MLQYENGLTSIISTRAVSKTAATEEGEEEFNQKLESMQYFNSFGDIHPFPFTNRNPLDPLLSRSVANQLILGYRLHVVVASQPVSRVP